MPDHLGCPMMAPLRTRFVLAAILLMLITSLPSVTVAGGTCLLHPEPFKLQSDRVKWSIRMLPGGQCIQGLRWSTIMIDTVTVSEQPKAGRLVVQGPSFRYLADPDARGSDSFKLTITGTSLRVAGTSTIEVDVAIP